MKETYKLTSNSGAALQHARSRRLRRTLTQRVPVRWDLSCFPLRRRQIRQTGRVITI
ncbi:unnamed protein product [Coregonus sp. 'balchen']|nr:unnamed protein product [Coregonus sp. 'balchen']